MAGSGHPCRIEAHQIGRHLLDRRLHLALSPFPIGPAHAHNAWVLPAGIHGEGIYLVTGYIEFVAPGVFHHHIIAGDRAATGFKGA